MVEKEINEYTSSILRISSDDRDLKQSINASNFTVNLDKNQPIIQTISKVSVKDFLAPNNFYNIRDGSNGYQNNVLELHETGQLNGVTITMPEGNYLLTEFLPALQTLINAQLVSGTVALTLGAFTKKITFTFTGTSVLIFDEEDGSSMAEVLGITDTSGFVTVFTCQSLPDLAGLRMIYCQSSDIALSNGIDSSFGAISYLESLSLTNTPFGGYAYVRNDSETLSTINYDRTKNLTKIRISLRDKKGNRLNIGTGEMTITLKIYY